MDPFSNRQKAILKYLLNSQDYVPAKEIAEFLGKSNKTVYRELDYIKKVLENNDISIDSQPGKGIKLCLTAEEKMKLNFKTQFKDIEFINKDSIEHRRKKILIDLLVNSPNKTSIQELSNKYYISRASIVNDLKAIEEKIQTEELRLLKDQKGTSIIGSELNIRKCLVSTMNELIEPLENKIKGKCYGRIDDKTFDKLSSQFGESNVRKIEVIINAEEKEMGITIGDPYFINLISHILILLKRIERGNVIKYCEPFVEKHNPDLKYLHSAERIGKALNETFKIKIPREEIYFIYQYLSSSGLGISYDPDIAMELVENTEEKTNKIVNEFISIAEEFFSSDFSDDRELYNGLLLHMKPMLNRLKYKVTISNPLLGDIKEEFPAVYNATSLISNFIAIKYKLGDISEDEIAYLALFLQAAIIKNIKHKNILVVCSTGIGTSHILETNIKYSFPKWNIKDIIPANYLKRGYSLGGIDLIISTINISSYELEKPVVYVTALFNNKDVKNVSQMLVKESLENLTSNSLESLKEIIISENIHFVKNSRRNSIIKKFIESDNKNTIINKQNIGENVYIFTKYNRKYKETDVKLLISNSKDGKGHRKTFLLIKVSNVNELKKLFNIIMKILNNKELLDQITKCSEIDEIKEKF